MRKVEVRLAIKVAPHEVIRAFTDEEQLKAWWGVDRALISIEMGGVYTLAWQVSAQGIGYVSTGIISSYNPQGKLEIRDFVYLNPERPFFGPTRLLLQAREEEEGSRVYLCQDGYQDGPDWDWYYEAVKVAWPVVMQDLKHFLEKE